MNGRARSRLPRRMYKTMEARLAAFYTDRGGGHARGGGGGCGHMAVVMTSWQLVN